MPEFCTAGLRLRLLDAGRGTDIRPRLGALERSQWLGRGAIEEIQLSRLRATLAWASRTVPRYRSAGLPVALRGLDGLQAWPVVTKAEMRAAPERFRPDHEEGPLRVFARRTGGSTGDPFAYAVDAGAFSEQWAAAFRAWAWTGWRLGESMATVGGGSVNPDGVQSPRQRIYNFLRGNRPLAIGSLDAAAMATILDSLRAAPPVLLYGYPSVLYALSERLKGPLFAPGSVRAVMTTSEMLFAGQRRVLAEAFGAPVFDMYGCNEVNLVTCECDRHAGLHVGMEAALVEILDEDGSPVPDGTAGRIVATGLLNRAMPMIRYDTGDRGAVDRTPCECGRGLMRIVGLEGRSRDFVRTPQGALVHGVVFNGVAMGHPWINRYQAIQEDEGHLTFRVSVAAAPGSAELERLSADLVGVCGLQVRIGVNEPFETTAGLKTRVVICRLENAR